jgi:hypothetical protein
MTNMELVKAMEKHMTIIAAKVLFGGMAIGMFLGYIIGAYT